MPAAAAPARPRPAARPAVRRRAPARRATRARRVPAAARARAARRRLAQDAEQAAQLGERLAAAGLDRLEGARRAVRVVDEVRPGTRLDDDHADAVRDDVVQLARDPSALLRRPPLRLLLPLALELIRTALEAGDLLRRRRKSRPTSQAIANASQAPGRGLAEPLKNPGQARSTAAIVASASPPRTARRVVAMRADRVEGDQQAQ